MKSKILIVDHKQNEKNKLIDILAEEYEVVKAENAYQALEVLDKDSQIQVVLLELLLPKMSGLELLQKLRSNNLYKDLIILVVAETGNTHEEITALGIGADDYICQPVAAEVVSARIKHILYNREILNSSECRFSLQRNLLDAMETAVFVVDAINHNLLYANNASQKLLQVSNDNYAGRKCYEYFFNKKFPCDNCKLFIAHTNENKTEVFIPKVTKTVNINVNLMEWLTRPSYVVYMNDVTEEKHARQLAEERYQKELRRRYRVDMDFMAYLVFNVTTGAVIEHDPHGFPVPTIYPGQPSSEFVERVLPTVIDYAKRKEFTEIMKLDNLHRAFQEGKTVLSIDYRRYSRNMKNIMWARSTIQLMEDPQSKDLIAFLYTYDINENKMMQEVISKAINYDYNMIADINLFSRSAKVYTSNGFGVDMLPKQEFDYQNAIEHYVSSFVVKQERDHVLQKMSLDNVRKQLKEKDSYEFDIKKVDSSGQHKKSKIRYVNLDKVYGTVLWTDRDITHIVNEEEQKQKELLEQVEELKELNRVKSDYLSTFGTSVRMPLKNILNNLKKIVNVCSHDATKGQLADIKHQLSKISDVINDIMVISNLEMQKVKFSEVQFTLSDLVATVTKDIKKKYLEKKITIECVEQVFHNSCLGDYKAIYKLLYNILDNACKFSGSNSDVQIAVYELPFKGQNEAFYRFVIKDNGCGIDTETMQHVFTPFSIYMNETGCKDSSGLGLSIAKIIVERLGGTISLESEVGAGTTVTIDLHMTFVDAMVKAAVPKPENQDSIQNKRLMLVKQNPLEVLVLRKLLESKGAKVYCADTEKEAVNLLESNYADFFQYIVVDVDKLQSEQKNAVLRQLKTHHKLGSAHLFALCSNADLDEKKALVESGACEVLFKPLRFAGLMNVLQEY